MRANILKEYAPLFHSKKRFFVYYGGRGGGKTENIAQCLVLMAIQKPLKILCVRESMGSIEESVKATIEKWIYLLGADEFFTIQKETISGANGSLFLFRGLKNHTASAIKSISGVNITWAEEADTITRRSWDLLVPSVIRTKDPKIIISFNPNKADDALYKEFISGVPPADSIIQKVNYDKNPFFKDSPLDLQRKDDLARLPYSIYAHKWLGELNLEIENSLFINCDFDPKGDLARDSYVEVIIACDPATTNKDFSNEYGIIVLGKLDSSEIRVISDESGHYSPYEFAQKVSDLNKQYRADRIIVEVNNGGDFIKAALIEKDPSLNVKEVRATRDKINRAIPVANLMQLRKIFFNSELESLKRQCELITNKGFLGAKGESPDRLDAFVWGVYYLANIVDKDSVWSFCEPQWIKPPIDFIEKAFLISQNTLFLGTFNGSFIGIVVNAWEFLSDGRIEIIDSFICDDLDTLQNELKDKNAIIARQNAIIENLGLECEYFSANKYRDINEKALNCLAILKSRKIWLNENAQSRRYGNKSGNLLAQEIMEFKLESAAEFALFDLFCDIIAHEFKLAQKES